MPEEVAIVSWRREWLLNAVIPEPILVSDSGGILWHLSLWRDHILDRKQNTGSVYCGSQFEGVYVLPHSLRVHPKGQGGQGSRTMRQLVMFPLQSGSREVEACAQLAALVQSCVPSVAPI